MAQLPEMASIVGDAFIWARGVHGCPDDFFRYTSAAWQEIAESSHDRSTCRRPHGLRKVAEGAELEAPSAEALLLLISILALVFLYLHLSASISGCHYGKVRHLFIACATSRSKTCQGWSEFLVFLS